MSPPCRGCVHSAKVVFRELVVHLVLRTPEVQSNGFSGTAGAFFFTHTAFIDTRATDT